VAPSPRTFVQLTLYALLSVLLGWPPAPIGLCGHDLVWSRSVLAARGRRPSLCRRLAIVWRVRPSSSSLALQASVPSFLRIASASAARDTFAFVFYFICSLGATFSPLHHTDSTHVQGRSN